MHSPTCTQASHLHFCRSALNHRKLHWNSPRHTCSSSKGKHTIRTLQQARG
jgi:hypothetical protein